jgi:hypothetical protein
MKMLLIGSNIVVSTLSLLDSVFVVRLIENCCRLTPRHTLSFFLRGDHTVKTHAL